MHAYYVRKTNNHVVKIKAKIMEDICSKFIKMKTNSHEWTYQNINDVSIYFRTIARGFTYDDFKIPIDKNIFLPYWYCCLTLFSTVETVNDFLKNELTDDEMINGTLFSIIGLNSKISDRFLSHYPFDEDDPRADFSSEFYLSEIEPIKEIYYSKLHQSGDSQSGEEQDDMFSRKQDDRTLAIILLIDEMIMRKNDCHGMLINIIGKLMSQDYDYLSKHICDESVLENNFGEAINLLTYIYRLSQKKRIDLTCWLDGLLDDIILHKEMILPLKKYKQLNLLTQSSKYQNRSTIQKKKKGPNGCATKENFLIFIETNENTNVILMIDVTEKIMIDRSLTNLKLLQMNHLFMKQMTMILSN